MLVCMGNNRTPVAPLRTGEGRKPPPGELALLQAFINTSDPDDDDPVEDFTDPGAVERWLVHYELMGAPDEPLGQGDFDHLLAFREALRAVLVAQNGGPHDPAAVDTLNAASRSAELLVRFDAAGEARLTPVRRGPDEAIARLLAIVQRAQTAGTWERLKGCPDDGCGWIFYDWSKNRSATWCSMGTCGNRAKARAYRERRRAAHAH
jgi:predicted RNA-binding Zn ribbon-like protein